VERQIPSAKVDQACLPLKLNGNPHPLAASDRLLPTLPLMRRPPKLHNALSSHSVREHERREFSTVSLVSERTRLSPRSSMSSDHNPYAEASPRSYGLITPNKTADITPRANNAQSTDPTAIHAITQTMIGEFLYKYTCRVIGKGQALLLGASVYKNIALEPCRSWFIQCIRIERKEWYVLILLYLHKFLLKTLQL
jgi:hypothetical protein